MQGIRPEAKRLILRWKEMSDTQTLIQFPEHGYEERIVFRLNLQAQNMKVTPLQVVEAEFRVSLCRL